MIIKVTGDTHGERQRLLDYIAQHIKEKNFDKLLICGDFGFIWSGNKGENQFLDLIEQEADFDILFVDGNHCLSKDTEILTENGWEYVENVYNNTNIKIANVDENNDICFDFPQKSYCNFINKAIEINGKTTSQLVSPEHNIILDNKKVQAKELLKLKRIKEKQITQYILQKNQTKKVEIIDDWIRLLTWVITDATIIDFSEKNKNSKKCTIQWHLSKERKIIELESLLNRMSIPYTKRICKKNGINKLQPYYIRIYSDFAREIFLKLNKEKQIPETWKNFNKEQLFVFLDTLKITDGTPDGIDKIRWTTTNKNDIDIIQEICFKNGVCFYFSIGQYKSGFKNAKKQYACRICPREKQFSYYANVKEVEYNDNMYCWTMPHGNLIIRRNGKVCLTGNCNFDEIYNYPVEEWNGGKIHRIRKNIIHLMRGEIYTINGKKILTFGGGYSIDKEWRIEHFKQTRRKCWWAQEFPTQEEIDNAFNNLEKNNWKVDYIFSHSAPTNCLPLIQEFFISGAKANVDIVNSTLETIRQKTQFEHWYFGHYHGRKDFDKFSLLYETSINLEFPEE